VSGPLHESLAIIATLGLIIGAAYYLWTLQRMFFGPYHLKVELTNNVLSDLDRREYLMLVPLAAATLYLGILPQSLVSIIEPFARNLSSFVLQTGNSLIFNP
jgi:NADH-quinone oxidoreductase subunit M